MQHGFPATRLPGTGLYGFLSMAAMVAALLASTAVHAHFNLDINIRAMHVVHTQQGLDVYLRLPTSLFLAGLTGPELEDGTVPPAPFTYNRIEQDTLFHFLDLKQIRKEPIQFASLAAQGHLISVDGVPLTPEIIAVRIHLALDQPPFTSPEEAEKALEGAVFPHDIGDIYVGETVTDVMLRYSRGASIDSYTIRSTLDPGLEGQEEIANLILDHFPGSARVYGLMGLLNESVEIKNSRTAAIATFIREGIKHILEGYDHILFILCLTLSAAGLGSLFWRVTGFTLGHTATLIIGFFGFVPAGAWFVPTVETAIALSIIYAGIIALVARKQPRDSLTFFVVTMVIGLIHGLGFSFILHELLLPNGAHLWKSLLSFNIGVEIGQLLIVTGVWILLRVIVRVSRSLLVPVRWLIAIPCIGLASSWTFERGVELLQIFQGS